MIEIESDKFMTNINIEKEKENSKFYEQQMNLEKKKQELKQKVELKKLDCDYQFNKLKTEDQLVLEKGNNEFKMQSSELWLNLDKNQN